MCVYQVWKWCPGFPLGKKYHVEIFGRTGQYTLIMAYMWRNCGNDIFFFPLKKHKKKTCRHLWEDSIVHTFIMAFVCKECENDVVVLNRRELSMSRDKMEVEFCFI